MDNSDYGFDRAAFDAVWHRVLTGQSNTAGDSKDNAAKSGGADTPMKQKNEPGIEDELSRMRGFMDDEAGDAALYAALAPMCSGCCRSTLLGMSADEKRHLKKLRARYFILTGQTYTPPGCCPLIRTFGGTLRLKYAGELEGSEAYREAAAETRDRELAELYASFAEDEARHRRLIGNLIESMF